MEGDPSQIWLVTEVETTKTVEVRPDDRYDDDVFRGDSKPRFNEQVTTVIRQRVPLDAIALKTQMNGLLNVVSDLFEQSQKQTGLLLDEVELSVEVNAEGQVSILGNGGKLADKGAIKLKFKRVPPTS